MAWARLDDTYHDNPKILSAWSKDRASIALHVMAITYCSRHETDGLVPIAWIEAQIPQKAQRQKTLTVLLDTGLFNEAGADSFEVHDYLEFNPSRQQARERRERISEKRAEAGRKGGLERARRQAASNNQANVPSNGEANCYGVAQANSSPVPTRPIEEGQT